jgi:hypothetical protein
MNSKLLYVALLMLSSQCNAEWLYEKSVNSGSTVHSAFVFDEGVENALSVSCDKKYNNKIITFLTDVKLSKKDNNVVSLTFDNESKTRYTADYGEGYITLSDYGLNEEKSSDDINSILVKFKTKSKIKFGFVTSSNISSFVEFSLDNSFDNISKVQGFCK